MGKLKSQRFTSPGAFTFSVPAGVTAGWITMGAGGGGGRGIKGIASDGCGAGASSEFIQSMLVSLPSGGTVTISVATGGLGGVAVTQGSHAEGAVGGSSTFDVFATIGGQGSHGHGTSKGGGFGGGSLNSGTGSGVIGTLELPCYMGGSGGGSGYSGPVPSPGGPAINNLGGSAGTGTFAGGGGGSSPWSVGGSGGAARNNGSNALGASAGGGGSGINTTNQTAYNGGNGGNGIVIIWWIG